MTTFPQPLKDLIEAFRKFPGIGEKSAQRFAFYLLRQPPEQVKNLAQRIASLQEHITVCQICGMIDETSPCRFDRDKNRDGSTICVVAETLDALVIENSGEYKGRYHVLGGVLNPLEGVTPEKLNIASLLERVKRDKPREIIIATNPDLEGETTALHLKKALAPFKVKVTRLGRGLPMGASLEYADEVTIASALRGRQNA